MASCGLRPGEVAGLRWGDWNKKMHGAVVSHAIENRTGTIKGLKTDRAGMKQKPAIFTDRAEALLLMFEAQTENTDTGELIFKRENGKPFLLETSNKHFKAACERAEIDRHNRPAYSLRHSFNTLLSKNVSLEMLQKAMGHITLQSSKRYLHPTDEDLLEQAQGIRNYVEAVFDER